MSAIAFRARSTGELLDAAFLLFRRHYATIVLGTGIFVGPVILLDLLLPASTAPLLRILSNLLYMTASAVVVRIASDAYVGNPVDLGAALRTVFDRFGSVWGASFIQGIVVIIGLLLLVVPGLIFLAWTFAMKAAVVVEGCAADDAFTRSRTLARGEVWRIARTVLLAYLIIIAGAFGLGLGIGAVGHFLGLPDVVTEALAQFAYLCVLPFASVVTTLLYYDLRIRKEGFDLEMLTRELGESPAGSRAGVVWSA